MLRPHAWLARACSRATHSLHVGSRAGPRGWSRAPCGAGLSNKERPSTQTARRQRAQAGELVAQFKATVLLMPNGSDRITAAPLQTLNPGRGVEDAELKKLLAGSLKSKKKAKPRKGKEKKKANGAGGEAGGAGGAAGRGRPGAAAPAGGRWAGAGLARARRSARPAGKCGAAARPVQSACRASRVRCCPCLGAGSAGGCRRARRRAARAVVWV